MTKTESYKQRQREAVKRYRKKDPERWRSYAKNLYEARRILLDGLKSKPCMDCGNSFPAICMDFDHRPGTVKKFQISVKALCALARIEKEIAKCDIVCANCHRIRTKQRGQYRR